MLLKIFLKDDVLRAVGNFLEPIDAWKFMMLSTQTRNQRQNNILWATLCVRDYGDDVSAKASSEENVVIDNDSGEHSLLESELESENGNDNDKYKISSSIRNEIAYFSSYQEPGSLFQLLAHVALRLKPGIQFCPEWEKEMTFGSKAYPVIFSGQTDLSRAFTVGQDSLDFDSLYSMYWMKSII
mmetsp:Transcript_25755/g.31652  ORF Transcript_25755/g.31652 Transcript_25755/m.31652 type:complete len:184 (+) Transcript_25755:80-631(+)